MATETKLISTVFLNPLPSRVEYMYIRKKTNGKARVQVFIAYNKHITYVV